jgi:hypothetical protein
VVVPARGDATGESWRETEPLPAGEPPAADQRPAAPAFDRTATPATRVAPGEMPAAGRSGEAPVALDDAYLVPQGDTLEVEAANGVLVNDLDPDGDDIIASNDSPPGHGSASMVVDGSFDYELDPGLEGTDIITYTSRDDHGTYSTSSARVASGTYVAELRRGGKRAVQELTLVK